MLKLQGATCDTVAAVEVAGTSRQGQLAVTSAEVRSEDASSETGLHFCGYGRSLSVLTANSFIYSRLAVYFRYTGPQYIPFL